MTPYCAPVPTPRGACLQTSAVGALGTLGSPWHCANSYSIQLASPSSSAIRSSTSAHPSPLHTNCTSDTCRAAARTKEPSPRSHTARYAAACMRISTFPRPHINKLQPHMPRVASSTPCNTPRFVCNGLTIHDTQPYIGECHRNPCSLSRHKFMFPHITFVLCEIKTSVGLANGC